MATDVTACNGLAHPVVAGGVGVSSLKRTILLEAAVHDDSGIEVTRKSIAENPLATAATDKDGNNSHEIVTKDHRRTEENVREEPHRRHRGTPRLRWGDGPNLVTGSFTRTNT